ncbi:SAM-dependent methyltransferase [Helicobacter sp.]|uniref:SAM-dependent methyltransferase n=1 Tax=Helicobacter sp. TaxID=218 RepID=UPI00199034A4|nr:SAM-dependent methyltransferase [Helicobacter sp.]MBD5166012.1 class I SAM-dependent methyltransferase [Helicobacter sp.]
MESQSFGALMQEWLYGEEGYYRKVRVGKAGDFYTNVSVGKFFGFTLGFYLQGILKVQKGRIAIIEIGSEQGDLIADIAEFLHLYGQENIEFWTLEPLKSLQDIQKDNFYQRLGTELQTATQLEDLKGLEVALFVSNELLDAFACELVFKGEMAFVEGGELVFKEANAKILEFARAFNVVIGEIPLGAFEFVASLSQVAPKWLFLGFDYGALDARNSFSLRLYTQHQTQNFFLNPTSKICDSKLLKLFGKVDLTYDVNFALWREAFLRAGGREYFLCVQNRALVDMGLDKMCEWYIKHFGLEHYMTQSSKIRTLISPGALGERFFGICFANFEI